MTAAGPPAWLLRAANPRQSAQRPKPAAAVRSHRGRSCPALHGTRPGSRRCGRPGSRRWPGRGRPRRRQWRQRVARCDARAARAPSPRRPPPSPAASGHPPPHKHRLCALCPAPQRSWQHARLLSQRPWRPTVLLEGMLQAVGASGRDLEADSIFTNAAGKPRLLKRVPRDHFPSSHLSAAPQPAPCCA